MHFPLAPHLGSIHVPCSRPISEYSRYPTPGSSDSGTVQGEYIFVTCGDGESFFSSGKLALITRARSKSSDASFLRSLLLSLDDWAWMRDLEKRLRVGFMLLPTPKDTATGTQLKSQTTTRTEFLKSIIVRVHRGYRMSKQGDFWTAFAHDDTTHETTTCVCQ